MKVVTERFYKNKYVFVRERNNVFVRIGLMH